MRILGHTTSAVPSHLGSSKDTKVFSRWPAASFARHLHLTSVETSHACLRNVPRWSDNKIQAKVSPGVTCHLLVLYLYPLRVTEGVCDTTSGGRHAGLGVRACARACVFVCGDLGT